METVDNTLVGMTTLQTFIKIIMKKDKLMSLRIGLKLKLAMVNEHIYLLGLLTPKEKKKYGFYLMKEDIF